MTSEISYSNGNKNDSGLSKKFLNINLLIDNIKRNKVIIIITGIIMFFASPFPGILMHMTRGREYYNTTAQFYDSADRNVLKVYVFGFMLFISIVLGLCLALSAMRYMHSRKASVFFGSIPIEKKTLFATQCLSGLIYFTVPLVIIYLISAAILPSYVTFISLTKIFSVSWFIFLFIYSFSVMCANIAGNALNSIVSAAYLAFIAPGLFGLFVFFMESFYRFTNISAITDNIPRIIRLPVLYFIMDIIENWPYGFRYSVLVDMVGMLLISAIFLFAGGLLNRINRTENAEKAFYFKTSQTIFKYTLLAIAVILTGVIFYQTLYKSALYMILGIVIGGFIAFLAINFIIYKNIREIFNGFAKFGIFIAASVLIMTVFSFDIFGIDKYVPATPEVESVTFSNSLNPWFNYSIYTYKNDRPSSYDYRPYNKIIKDPETIELISGVIKASMKSTPAPSYSGNGSYDLYDSYMASVRGAEIGYTLTNGTVVSKQIPYNFYFKNESDADGYKDAEYTLTASKQFKESFFAPITESGYMENLLSAPGVSSSVMFFDYDDGYNHTVKFDNEELLKFIERLRQDILSDVFVIYADSNFSYAADITITVHSDEGFSNHQIYFCVNESFKNTIEFIRTIIANQNTADKR